MGTLNGGTNRGRKTVASFNYVIHHDEEGPLVGELELTLYSYPHVVSRKNDFQVG